MDQKTAPAEVYVGIDIHHSSHKVAIIPLALMEKGGRAWKQVKPLSITNCRLDFEKLDRSIKEHNQDPSQVSIAIDHTGGYYSAPIVNFLSLRGYRLWYLEAKALKKAKNRFLDQENKTDEIDAVSMARILYARDILNDDLRISAVSPELGSEAATMRALCLQRLALDKLITQATNRLRQFLVATFPEGESLYFTYLARIVTKYPTPQAILTGDLKEFRIPQKVADAIRKAATDTVGICSPVIAASIIDVAQHRLDLISKKSELTAKIENLVKGYPYGPILTSFPCLGEVGAATLIGVIRNIDRWPSKKCLRKALGVYPTVTRSGAGAAHSVMGREGSREARRVLWQMVFSNLRKQAKPNIFRDYYQMKVNKGMKGKPAIVATMGKVCEIIYHCLKEGEVYIYKSAQARSLEAGDACKSYGCQLTTLPTAIAPQPIFGSQDESKVFVIGSLARGTQA